MSFPSLIFMCFVVLIEQLVSPASFHVPQFPLLVGQTYGGGAIEADNGSSIDIVNTNFKRNTAGFGGAIDVSGGAYANIVSSYFRRNNATVAGGAISFVGNSNGNITYAYFANNFASVGGAVHIKTANASICKSFPKNNTASLTVGFLSPFFMRSPFLFLLSKIVAILSCTSGIRT